MSAELPPWVAPGARVVWLRHGGVAIDRIQALAGEPYVVVTPVGWSGEPGWIAARGLDLHLRPLRAAEVCARWLAELGQAPVRRGGGGLEQRRRRHRRAAELGTAEQQVAALREAYAEAHHPDIDDDAVLDLLERAVVVEIASVLGRDLDELRAELRARPRFGDDAPRSGQVVEAAPAGPPLPPGFTWFAAFDVGGELAITELEDTDLCLPAAAGRWHAAHVESDAWIAVAEAHLARLPLDPAAGRVALVTEGNSYPLAVLDGAARQDPVIEDELLQCESFEVDGRGAASFWRRPAEIRVWEVDGVCVAVAVSMVPEEDEDDDDEEPEPPPWLVRKAVVARHHHGAVDVEMVGWDSNDGRHVAVVRAVDDAREVARIPLADVAQHLRPLIDAVTAQQALEHLLILPSPMSPPIPAAAPPGFAADLEALAAAYQRPHRPDAAEAEALIGLERIVLGELAAVLGLDRSELRSRCRAVHARFGPAAAAPARAAPADLALPPGHRWISSFEVEGSLQVTDLTTNALSLPARRGTWHGLWHEHDGAVTLLAVSAASLPSLPLHHDDVARTRRADGGRDFPLAILDSRALQSSLVSTALTEGSDVDVLGRGVAWLSTSEPLEIRTWELDGLCIAVALSA